MIGLLQRVTDAAVHVDGTCIGRIDAGLLVLVGVVQGDIDSDATRLAERLATYRVFPDEEDRMNRSLVDTGGAMLAVPQFTLAADTGRGRRPSFGRAAAPDEGQRLFQVFCGAVGDLGVPLETGEFGADMKVQLTNDGPVTFWLSTR
ncbi:MAG: D-aminoacyl-tRNA deacylase [Pseudomonadota bacterium]